MYLELAIIALILVLSFILLIKNFDLAIYILLALSVLLHKELFSFYKWDLLPVRAFMLALVCYGVARAYIWLMKNRNTGLVKEQLKNFFKDPFILILIATWAINGLSLFFSTNLYSSLVLFGFFTSIVFLGILIYLNFRNSPEKTEKYIKFYIYVALASCLFGYFQFFYYDMTGVIIGSLWNIPGNLSRVGAFFWDVNHFGALLSALLPILGVLILTSKTWSARIFNSLAFLLMLGILFLTSSRTAWMIAFFALLTFVSILLIRKLGIKAIGLVFVVLMIIAIPLTIEYSDRASPFRARIKHFFHYRMDSFDSHFMLLTGAFQVYTEYPILGGGYGSFFEHFSKTPIAPVYFGRDPAALSTRVPAHTIWGQTAAETGSAGLSILVLFISLIFFTLLYGAITFKDTKKFLMMSAMVSVIVGWMIAGIFYSYNSEFFYIILFLFFTYGVANFEGGYNPALILERFVKPKRTVLFITIVLAGVLIFANLGKNHLIPWDEAIYAKIAKNMVVNNNVIDMNWKPNLIWYEKPPLYMWEMAFLMKYMGFNSLAARLPSAIAGFLGVIAVFLFASKFLNKTVGFFSAFILLTSVHFLYYTRASMLDVTATLFMSLSLYFYYIAKKELGYSKWIISGVFLGFGVMTKGVVGLLPFVVMGFYEIYLLITKQQKITSKLVLNWAALVLISSAVFFPWHIEMYKRHGSTFLANYVGYHVWDRATVAIEDKGNPAHWYLIVLKVSMRIWSIVLLLGIPLLLSQFIKSVKNKEIHKSNLIVFLTIWSILILIFFSIAKSKLVWYILPIYPALSIIAAITLDHLYLYFVRRFKKLDNLGFKFLAIYFAVVFMLTYLVINRELVYTSDLTGSQSRLIKLKDERFKVDEMFYIDRVELPLALFYTDGPFEIIDFRPDLGDRVPEVSYDQRLILLTKKGRFSTTVENKVYEPKVVQEDGDWILWYFDSEKEEDQDRLNKAREDINSILFLANNTYGGISFAPDTLREEYFSLLRSQETLIKKINSSTSF